MNRKIENRFLANYVIMFIISSMIGLFAFMLLAFANDVISKTLVKNNYTAETLMRDNYKSINTKSVTYNGGGVQIINADYKIVFSKGINTILKDKLTIDEFTDFLIMSKSKGILYNYSIKYNSKEKFWLVITFPTSIRIDFDIVHNKDFASVDSQGVVGVIVAVGLFYLILLAISTVIYSKITSISIITPLKKLCKSARCLKDGDYSSRVNLNLKNEFGELEYIFNEMAKQIQQEISNTQKSEENRKRLILDISHDLKNPLASIMGYAEFCCKKADLSKEEQSLYLRIIYDNGLRANNLITNLFELSKMESSEYRIKKTKVDICEYMREEIGTLIAAFNKASFIYDFDIPEDEVFLEIDTIQMDRVLQNLASNALKYNLKGTKITISLFEQTSGIVIIFKDDGIGMSKKIAKNIFEPFIRFDNVRNLQIDGTGLGLAIALKIIVAHGGNIRLKTDNNCGCEFIINIPKI
ncbi:HAMP domain-containing histidine kinase [Clostridium estertheticum]|uniref:HAMP domain-containing sensor histidine kinase n=1 Tax=Clostridium estertheticum TaxID=238834 RepID=UPI001C7CFACD|nr:HAMP domain-containing sensor histidine kinase [Clostridium estertheticum]MBX4260828.1 HAMP domain-containing histidine kinase [Clostridium estertheticum]WLC71511.1 HAMP domain-containing histidine kinase [Clostridium estertheticum]